jgi:hypothetical protein
MAEVYSIVSADGQGAARAAPAKAFDPPDQLHDGARDMMSKPLILLV